MELTISQRKTYKIKYQFVIYTCIISFLFSLVRIDTTCLLFTLPFFYLCFLCGYYALLSYSIGMIISILFFHWFYCFRALSIISINESQLCSLFINTNCWYLLCLLSIRFINNIIINNINLYKYYDFFIFAAFIYPFSITTINP